MQLKVIQFLLSALIIYTLLIFHIQKYTKFDTVKSIQIMQSIMMTFGASGFIYSYMQYVKSTNEKFINVATNFPKKWQVILNSLNSDNSISPGIKKWVLTGKINEDVFKNLSLSDINLIEQVVTSFYELWLNMVSIDLIKNDFTFKDYDKLFKNAKNDLITHLNVVIGVLFEKDFVFNHIMTEKQFYPKGFITYISYCVRTLRKES